MSAVNATSRQRWARFRAFGFSVPRVGAEEAHLLYALHTRGDIEQNQVVVAPSRGEYPLSPAMAANLAQYCPAALYAGGCATRGCTLSHKAQLCQPCGILCISQAQYQAHTHGKRHRGNVRDTPGTVLFPFCVICERDIGSLHVWKAHVGGARHRKMATSRGVSPKIDAPDASQLSRHAQHCSLCSCTILKTRWSQHVGTVDHKRREAIAAHRGAFERAEQDKGGIVVSPEGDVDFGTVSPAQSQAGVHKILVLHLAARAPNVSIQRVEMFDRANHTSTS